MSQTLFREETESARANAWLGRIVLIRPIAFSVLCVLAMLVVALLAAFFILGEYSRKARVTGTLVPAGGVSKVIAPQAGRIELLQVHEGEIVVRDQPLMVVSDVRGLSKEGRAARVLAARFDERLRHLAGQRRELAAALAIEDAALEQRARSLERQRQSLEGEIAVQVRRAELAADSLARAEQLAAIGFVSEAALDRERAEALDQANRVRASQRARMAIEQDIASIASERVAAQARTNAQLAGVDGQGSSIGQERQERELQLRATVLAPAAGSVAALLVEPGQMVTAGTPLATILERDDELEAHLYAPSKAIGFVRPGQSVLLRYLAYPYQKFGSHRALVRAVSRSPLPAAELGFTPPDGTREPLYRIKVALPAQAVEAYGDLEPLQAGMQVEADILLDRRRLIEWIFEPLISLAGRT